MFLSDAIIMSEAPRLSRQPTIVFRSPGASKQSSLDESYPAGILYENEEMETPNGAGRWTFTFIIINR